MKKNKRDFIEVNAEARAEYLASTKELGDSEFLAGLTKLILDGSEERDIDPVWVAEHMVGAVKLGVMFRAFMNEPEEETEDEGDEALEALKEALHEEHNR